MHESKYFFYLNPFIQWSSCFKFVFVPTERNSADPLLETRIKVVLVIYLRYNPVSGLGCANVKFLLRSQCSGFKISCTTFNLCNLSGIVRRELWVIRHFVWGNHFAKVWCGPCWSNKEYFCSWIALPQPLYVLCSFHDRLRRSKNSLGIRVNQISVMFLSIETSAFISTSFPCKRKWLGNNVFFKKRSVHRYAKINVVDKNVENWDKLQVVVFNIVRGWGRR